jgi:hypothetical protein
MVPGTLPVDRMTVAMPFSSVTAVVEARDASVPGWEIMERSTTSFVTGLPTVSSTLTCTSTVLPVDGVVSLTEVVTLPTGAGYWAKAIVQDAARTMAAPMVAKTTGCRTLRDKAVI